MYPRLLELGPVSFPTYGVFAAIALIAGLGLATRTAARLGVRPEAMWNLCLITVFTAALGSRLLLFAAHWRDFLSYPLLMFSITSPSSINSVLTKVGLGMTAGLFYMTWKHMSWRSTLDAAAPAWALSQAILLLGCFFAGCDYGRPTAMPWGVTFHSRWALLWNGTPLEVRLHPVQLYLCAVELILCAGLLTWLPHRRQPGELAGAWLLAGGLTEFFLDFFRGGTPLWVLHGAFSLTQAMDFVMVILGAGLLLQSPAGSTSLQAHRSQAE